MKLQVMMEVEVPEDLGSFQEAEQKIRNSMFKSGQEMMLLLFKHHEARSLESKSFWMKDKRSRIYQTLVGEFQIQRLRVFDHKHHVYRYPLDEWLGVGSFQKVTPGLRDMIVESVIHHSYRQSGQEIFKWTGIKRSPISDWKLVQEHAENQKTFEKPVFDWKLKPLPQASQKNMCPILAIDPDGTYCKNQDGEGKDHDVKMAVLYTGKEIKGNKSRLLNKQVLMSKSNESVSDFFNRVTQTAMTHYGAHRDTKIIVHGDGDTWIKGLKSDYWESALLRLDPWHLKKKIRLVVGDVPPEWEANIYGKPDLLVTQINLWKVQKTSPDSQERKKAEELVQYIKNNREGLLPSGVSKEEKDKYPGMYKRGSGTIESQVGHCFGARFKLPRMSWSTRGLDNLSYLREKYLNRNLKPQYTVPQPLTRQRIALKLGRQIH